MFIDIICAQWIARYQQCTRVSEWVKDRYIICNDRVKEKEKEKENGGIEKKGSNNILKLLKIIFIEHILSVRRLLVCCLLCKYMPHTHTNKIGEMSTCFISHALWMRSKQEKELLMIIYIFGWVCTHNEPTYFVRIDIRHKLTTIKTN